MSRLTKDFPSLSLHEVAVVAGKNVQLGMYLGVCTKHAKLVAFYEKEILIVINQKVLLSVKQAKQEM